MVKSDLNPFIAAHRGTVFLLLLFCFVFGIFSCRCEKKQLGNLVSLFGSINHHSDWRKRKKEKKDMVNCLIVRTQEYFTEILYLIVKFGGSAGTSLTIFLLIIIQSKYFPVSYWLKLHAKIWKETPSY